MNVAVSGTISGERRLGRRAWAVGPDARNARKSRASLASDSRIPGTAEERRPEGRICAGESSEGAALRKGAGPQAGKESAGGRGYACSGRVEARRWRFEVCLGGNGSRRCRY